MAGSNKEETQLSVHYIVYEEAQAKSERTIKRLTIGIIVISILSIIVIFLSNYFIDKGWRDYFSSCDIQNYEYEQDGKGVNIVGDQNGVDYNGAESENQADNTKEQSEN